MVEVEGDGTTQEEEVRPYAIHFKFTHSLFHPSFLLDAHPSYLLHFSVLQVHFSAGQSRNWRIA